MRNQNGITALYQYQKLMVKRLCLDPRRLSETSNRLAHSRLAVNDILPRLAHIKLLMFTCTRSRYHISEHYEKPHN